MKPFDRNERQTFLSVELHLDDGGSLALAYAFLISCELKLDEPQECIILHWPHGTARISGSNLEPLYVGLLARSVEAVQIGTAEDGLAVREIVTVER